MHRLQSFFRTGIFFYCEEHSLIERSNIRIKWGWGF